jgi:Fe-S cluster assembly iron-binding protein IscA
VFFYDAGCSGSKVNIVFDDFEIDESLVKTQDEFAIYVEKEDEEKFE